MIEKFAMTDPDKAKFEARVFLQKKKMDSIGSKNNELWPFLFGH